MGFQCVDHKLDVLIEIHAEQFDAAADDFPIHLGGKGFVLQLLGLFVHAWSNSRACSRGKVMILFSSYMDRQLPSFPGQHVGDDSTGDGTAQMPIPRHGRSQPGQNP